MKLNDLLYYEVASIDGALVKMIEKETGRTIISFTDSIKEDVEIGDIVVHQVVEIGNTYDNQETFGTNIIEVKKKLVGG